MEPRDHWTKTMEKQFDCSYELKPMADAQPGNANGTDVPILSNLAKPLQSSNPKPIDTAALVQRKQEQLLTKRAALEAARAR